MIPCYLLIWLLVLITPARTQSPSQPASIDTLRQLQEHIDQQRSDVLKERDRLWEIEQATQDKLKGILYHIHATDTAYKDYNFQIQVANQRIQELQQDLAIAERIYYQKRAATIARLRWLQRQRHSGSAWDFLLKSQNFKEFLDRRQRLKLVYQADRQSLTDLKAKADKIKQQHSEVERQKNQIALLTQQLLAQKSQLEAQLRNQQQLIERLNNDRQALEAAQEQLAADSQGIGNLIRSAMAKARYPHTRTFGTGQLAFPSNGEITSNFGWRTHPLLGKSRFHNGIDFGASYGSTIRAADAGRVIFAGWYGGYGYAVVINHGGGLATLYAHSSKLYVKEGQTVQRGDAIAAVGSTGLSTGPHLHFEVRKNGEPVDPIRYL
ncbi:MAG: peptidoglycan DD-metalloendopeptidase family protein [Symploca sp. SIO3C6]|uniref:Peptidoglycan DD-metalloendopeptidase family protein n=1 Tax=Symploca sp. SIO1C4 TaxID=2607765 RepID=A0A6B3NGV8_9CYAN|nr:peptidoglycan DD-metalloendopeptidase family protein [Symploca sp. SIO3C6]NER28861.1 peptidoglycan DD-metalloendopeptidase family protein [Symploca sp. SIO1C4]NET06865.1 peptidoglycan DD-metalloendopeptidase family protein [Symploca sp. SIO2B6]